jgi:hypothetical protein
VLGLSEYQQQQQQKQQQQHVHSGGTTSLQGVSCTAGMPLSCLVRDHVLGLLQSAAEFCVLQLGQSTGCARNMLQDLPTVESVVCAESFMCASSIHVCSQLVHHMQLGQGRWLYMMLWTAKHSESGGCTYARWAQYRYLAQHRSSLCALAANFCAIQLGQSRWLYIMLWMAKYGNGLVPPRNIIVAAKRLRVT